MTKSGRRLRVAVIGCGTIAHEHLAYLRTSPMVSLVAICDASRALAEFMAGRFGAETFYTDHKQMLAEQRVDVVHVLTPPHTHVAIVSDVLRAEAHAICEKPLAPTLDETAGLFSLAREKRRHLVEGHNLLYNDVALAIGGLIEEDRLGAIEEIDVLLTLDLTAGPFGDLNLGVPLQGLPGGAVHDYLPHLAYLFLHFAGDPEATYAVCGKLENRSGNPRVGYDHLDALVEAGAVSGRLRISSRVKPDAFRLAVRGRKASVEVDFYNPFRRVEGGGLVGKLAPFEQLRSGVGLLRSGVGNLRAKVARHGTYHGLPRMLEATYRSLGEGGAPPITEQQVLATASLVERLVALRTSP